MSEEPFKVYKAHKLLDWLENEVTEWALDLVNSHFGVSSPEELTEDQINEVISEWEELSDAAGYDWPALGLRNIINIWENENETYLI